MANGVLRVRRGVQLVPNTTTIITEEGDLAVNSTDKELEVFLDSAARKVVTKDQAQTLTNKTLTDPTVNGGDLNDVDNLSIKDQTDPDFSLAVESASGLDADRTLTVDVNNADRTIDLSGNLTVTANATIEGTLTGSSSGTNTGDVTLAPVGSSPVAEGASLAGQVLTLQPASVSHPGVVSTGTQEFAGVKTLTSPVLNTADINSPDISDAVLALRDGTEELIIAPSSGLTADRTLTLDVNDANRTIDLTGNLTVTANATIEGTLTGSSSGTNTGDVTLGAVGATPNANGASLSGQVLNLEPASSTHPGVVSTTTQTFAGDKSFENALIILSRLVGSSQTDTTTGATATLAAVTKPIKYVDQATLTGVHGITAPTDETIFILTNKTGAVVAVANDGSSATAANRIITGTNGPVNLSNGASLLLTYDLASSRWRVIGGAGGGGAYAVNQTVQTIGAGGLITIDPFAPAQVVYVRAAAGANITLGGNLTNVMPSVDGAQLQIFNASARNQSVTMNYGGKTEVNGKALLTSGRAITFQFDADLQLWNEVSRNF